MYLCGMENPLLSQKESALAEIAALEAEIARMEADLVEMEGEINAFGVKLRAALAPEIARLDELSALYKAQKAAKKAKRLDQKKRGKHYQEPKGLKKSHSASFPSFNPPAGSDELKKLYREAIVHVHPDKMGDSDDDLADKATELTAQLNQLYDAGDLDGMRDFHLHILSGNALSHQPFQPQSAANAEALLVHLYRQRDKLKDLLVETEQNHLYHVLKTYPYPIDFLGELQIYFRDRIAIMEKRTRIHKQGKK